MVENVYTKFYSVDTSGCSSNALCKQARMMVAMYTPRSIVSTLTVAVATLSVNKLKDGWKCVH